jgi:rare lipoprotein A
MVFAKWSSTKKFKMKKSILLFLLIAFVTLASSQTMITDKQKTSVQKDTVNKSKILALQQEMTPDSLFINGNFKFYKKAAHASYYADKFHGKKTSSGKKYNKNKYTAAHKKLPFGTIVKVTNEVNGKSVTVEITDRGPFVRAREIDLSKRAFMDIASNKSSGAMLVTIEVLQK